jgi:transposase
MAKPSSSTSRGGRIKALPWAAVLQAGMVVGDRWRRLSEKDRLRVRTLLRQSGGRPSKLSARERKELRQLAGKLDLKGMGRDLLPLARSRGRRRGRRGVS